MALMATMVIGGLFSSCEKEKTSSTIEPIVLDNLYGKWEFVDYVQIQGDSKDEILSNMWNQLEFREDGTLQICYAKNEDGERHCFEVRYELTAENDLIITIDEMEMIVKCASIDKLESDKLVFSIYYFNERRQDEEGGSSYWEMPCDKEDSNYKETGNYNRVD